MTERKRRLPVRRVIIGLSTLALSVLILPNLWVWAASAGRVIDVDELQDAPDSPVAIVLGASVYASGDPSPWLRYRLDAAAELYESGRVESILVSGDNGQVTYNEPVAMRDYLVSVGVPSQAIAVDYAGFDTYDTCVRAHEIFGVDQAVLVSQDFHMPRAVAVCRAAGVDAFGVGDTRASGDRPTWVRSWLRERLAVIKAAWDVASQRDPILGNRETTVDDAVAWTQRHRGEHTASADAPEATPSAAPEAGPAATPGPSATPEAGPPAPSEASPTAAP